MLVDVAAEGAALALGRWLLRGYFAWRPQRRALALENLRAAGYVNAEEIGATMVEHLARDFSLLLRLGRNNKLLAQRWLRVEGGEHLHEARKSGAGAVVAIAHTSGWELSLALAAAHFANCVTVTRPLPHPRLERVMHRRRTSSGGLVHPAGANARPLLEHLHRGAAVCVAADLRPPAGRGVEARFFGQPVRADDGAARLARLARVPLLLGWSQYRRAEHRYVLTVEPVPATADVGEASRWILARVEQIVRADPAQWIWMHDRWSRRRR